MQIFHNKISLKNCIQELKLDSFKIGFVPTMGALHEGHASLVKKALEDNDYVVVSIFVNPTQFDNKDDLDNYPKTLETDVELLKTISAYKVIVYAPSVEDIYENNVASQSFSFDGLEHEMEGRFRDGHFNGVGTIVKRLFEIVTPDNAYFGEKDFQQLIIIKKLVETYDIPVKIIGCEIYREPDGLAMSSRNMRLKPNYRAAAPFIYETLKTTKNDFGIKSVSYITEWVEQQFANHELLELEYFTIADVETLKTIQKTSNKNTYRAFIAVYADDIRLIDNIALN